MLMLCLILSGGFAAFAQGLASGPQVLTFHSSVDDTEQPYGLYLPENYDASRAYPFVLMLHGAGSNHRLALKRVFGKSNTPGETDVEASRYFQDWQPEEYIVAAPLARGTMGYQGIAEKDVLDVVADVKNRFLIDENRMYLTGLSMGGGGTLWIGLSYPDMWAAIAPVCPAPPGGTDILAPNAINFPVHIFQGGADPVVRPETVRAWVDRFKKESVSVGYDEFPGVQHNSWENAYADQAIFDWFSQYERNPFPDRVRYVTDRFRHDGAYWVRFDQFTPGLPASIDAKMVKENQVEITTDKLKAFSLHLTGHPKYVGGKAVSLRIDGQSVRADVGAPLSFVRNGSLWAVQKDLETDGLMKKKGAEGPMSEVLSDRHVYVYGTAGEPSEAELAQRREQAEKAANWAYYRGEFLGRVMVFPRVLSDKQVRPSDLESANLVLFGDAATNTVIANLQGELPLQFSGDPATTGIAYIYPHNGHYVLVNSGLSIMEAPDSEKAIDGLTRFSSPAMVFALKKFDDYVIFSKDKVLAGGLFDNQWQLPAAARGQVQATKAVTLK
ncbi:phospholipase [Flavilitoribacter nigricans DSM 23189 = NBRC 102662]|uniref:Phospholipase n=2 Tax=Flavilitoribacter TaxID=2762562 RepID=A0A2D0NB70_FLAN2|nr:phospholipase [Flavilitoribacter nigricans DSM 23189 = NBRC 102662]